MSIFKMILKDKEFHLTRRLRLAEVTMAGVGFILGAGIYVLIGAVADHAGSAIWLSFFLAGLVALFSGLSYAELSSMFPGSESEYKYVNEGLGKRFAFFSYVAIIFALTIGIAGVSLGFAGYFAELTGFYNTQAIAFGVIFLFGLINWYSVKYTARVTFICTLLSILGLFVIVFLAFFSTGSSTNFMIMPEGLTGVVKGASLIFFAYLGFEGIVKLSEETKKAKINIPLAIIFSIIISSVVYFAVALAAVHVLPWDQLASSQAPLADVAASVLGSNAFFFIGIIALLSTANTILMGIFSASRGFYGLGQILKKFRVLSKVGKRSTPTKAIFLASLLAVCFIPFKEISVVVGFTNFLVFVTFILVNFSVIMLRRKRPKARRKFKIPFSIRGIPVFPVIGILITFFLLINLQPIHIIGGIIASAVILLIYHFIYNLDK